MINHPIESIPDKNSFIIFLGNLHQDYLQNPDKWENKTLEAFLEAMVSYSENIQGYYDNTNQQVDSNIASWKVFADMLKGASMYE
jgi:hypothetical protein